MAKPTPWLVTLLLLLGAETGCSHLLVPPVRTVDYDVVVVGAGMGGLSAATHLAVGGMKVLVLEQHHKVGGCTTSFRRGEYNFEAALHEMDGLGAEGHLRKNLKKAGIFDRVEWIRIPHLYRSIFPDLDITLPGDPEEMEALLAKEWPDEVEGIARFFELLVEMRTQVQELGEMYRFSKWKRFWRIVGTPIARPTLFKYYDEPVERLLNDLFESETLKAVLAQLWVYYGPPPKSLWTPIFLLANESYTYGGAWHVKGSSQALADAYVARIRELGGEVRTGTRVVDIEVTDNWVQGVVTEGGERISSRYVVSNADPFQTLLGLVGEEHVPADYLADIRALKPSNSLVGLYLGLDVEPAHWQIDEHELFYNTSYDEEAMYAAMLAEEYDKGALAMTFYTNLGDTFYAPPGKSVVVLHAYADAANWPTHPQAYQEHKEQVANQLLDLAEKVTPGLRDHIVVQEMVTPRSLEAYTLQHNGVPYGFEFSVEQGLKRPANNTPIGGLYMAGSWVQPSHGVSAAQLSGYQAARLILDGEEEVE